MAVALNRACPFPPVKGDLEWSLFFLRVKEIIGKTIRHAVSQECEVFACLLHPCSEWRVWVTWRLQETGVGGLPDHEIVNSVEMPSVSFEVMNIPLASVMNSSQSSVIC